MIVVKCSYIIYLCVTRNIYGETTKKIFSIISYLYKFIVKQYGQKILQLKPLIFFRKKKKDLEFFI